jgi:hypothetical protein
LTEDHKYLLVNDELDEQQSGQPTRTYIFDVQDLNNVSLIGTHLGSTNAIDHNLYTHEGLVYQSNYRAGLRILDLANVAQGQLEEVAFFDVYPASNSAQFNGTWSNYPYFGSGNVIVSHIEEGLYIVRPNIIPPCEVSCGCTDATACNYDPNALNEDGSCDFSCYGCTDPAARAALHWSFKPSVTPALRASTSRWSSAVEEAAGPRIWPSRSPTPMASVFPSGDMTAARGDAAASATTPPSGPPDGIQPPAEHTAPRWTSVEPH